MNATTNARDDAEKKAQQHEAAAVATANAAAHSLADLRAAIQAIQAQLGDAAGPLLDLLDNASERLDEAQRANKSCTEAWRTEALARLPSEWQSGRVCKADLLAECQPLFLRHDPAACNEPRAMHVAGRRLTAQVRHGRLLVHDATSGALLAASVPGLHKQVDYPFTEALCASTGARLT